MSFEEGHGKVGGRLKGAPNKRTLDLVTKLEESGLEPIQEIIALMPELSPKERVDVYRDLLTYLYPKRKALEVSPDSIFQSPVRPLSGDEIVELVKRARGLGSLK